MQSGLEAVFTLKIANLEFLKFQSLTHANYEFHKVHGIIQALSRYTLKNKTTKLKSLYTAVSFAMSCKLISKI